MKRMDTQLAVGTRIVLDSMKDPAPLTSGSQGTFEGYEKTTGDLIIAWDCGSQLKLIEGVDEWHVISSDEEIEAFLTTQNIQDNAKISEGFREGFIKFYDGFGTDGSGAWWNDKLAVRRLGHILEYGLLGMASAIAFCESHRLSVVKAVGLCLIISILDQIIKILVPVRHFDVIDIGFDLVGAVIGIGITIGLMRLMKRA